MRIVVALGGNALLERGERPDAMIQRRHVEVAARALAPLAAEHELVICHGNGPQIGLLALESSADPALSEPYPLDVLNGQTQGMIGYWLGQELRNAGLRKPFATIVSQTVVDPDDPAMSRPTKFIGPVYDEHTARHVSDQYGWAVRPDGRYWRRVVPSPRPVRLVELDAATALLAQGFVVVAGGGGGIPVIESDAGLRGVEAVVDKDATAAMMAVALDADRLLILTDVAAVMRNYGTAAQEPIDRLTPAQIAASSYPDGSMGPKIEACAAFAAATGRPCAIGALRDAVGLVAGTAGTQIVPDPAELSLSR